MLKLSLIREKEAGEGEVDSPLSREPDAGLDPRTLRSWSELKETLNQLSHPGAHISHGNFSKGLLFFFFFKWPIVFGGHNLTSRGVNS